MNSILGFTQRLIKRIGSSVAERDLDSLQTVDRNAKHLLALINDILDLSKIEAGKMELDRRSFDLNNLVHEVHEELLPIAETRDLTLLVELPKSPLLIEADQLKLRQILINLMSNAIKYTEKGTVTVLISATEDEAMGSAVRIVVRDTGIGIEEKDLGRLFQHFTQLDASPTRKVGGTGLGLVITSSYVKLHGGRIDVSSTMGKGSEFTVLLPLVPASAKPATPAPPAMPREVRTPALVASGTRRPDGTPLKILCVDDEPDILKYLQEILGDAGFEVLQAHDHDSALAQARSTKPDMICLDVRMPGRDGHEVLHALRRDVTLSSIPVVMISVDNHEAKAMQNGAQSFLAKPVSPDLLVKTVRSHVGQAVGGALVVEDDADTRELLCADLSDAGINVHRARNGEEALRLLEGFTPAVIVLDLSMPKMDGATFLKFLRSAARWEHIPVVVLTARDLRGDELMRLNAQTSAILTKGRGGREQLVDVVIETVAAPHSKRVPA